MSELLAKRCGPCHIGGTPLSPAARDELLEELGGGWRVIDGHHLRKEWSFDDFVEALAFTNRVGEIAEQEGHHPNIHLTYGEVAIDIYTHAVDGLMENDFILAAKIDAG